MKQSRFLLRAGTLICAADLAVGILNLTIKNALGQSGPGIVISAAVPNELNPGNGGAPTATPEQASEFAWQEFIALNWPAGPQQGQPGQREAPSTSCQLATLLPAVACSFGKRSEARSRFFPATVILLPSCRRLAILGLPEIDPLATTPFRSINTRTVL